MSIQLVMPSNHLILCHPLPLQLSIFPIIRVFSSESVLCIRWPKNRSFVLEKYWQSKVLEVSHEFAQIHVDWVHDAIQPSHLLSPPSPPTFNLSQHQGLFQWVGSSHQVAKYWSFRFSISSSSEYLGLISFRINWFDLLAVQGTLKSLLQNHNSKASILRHSDFFMVQLSHPYMTTRKTIAWTMWTFVSNVSAF